MASLLPGYSRLPGKSRRYLTPSGESISRRAYENKVFQSAGWQSWADYQRTAKDPQYRAWREAAAGNYRTKEPYYKAKNRLSHGYYKSLGRSRVNDFGLAEPDSEFNQAYLAARDAGFEHQSEGPFARFLTQIGLRNPTANFDVGDTP